MKRAYNILIASMALDIGGAETHVVELAKGLKKSGFNPFVVSTGGVFEKDLKDLDIPHFIAPLNKKDPISVIKSIFILNKIIKEEKIDIVHAHARIAAFLCNIVRRMRKFHFVTTSHGIRSKYIGTTWGEKTFAVGEHIKEQLIDDFAVKEKNIILTVNGIDMEVFDPDNSDFCDIVEEFKIDRNDKILLHVSRFDEDRKNIIFLILDSAFEILQKNEDVSFVMVGHGNVFEDVQKRVGIYNSKLKKPKIILTSARTDVNKFLALCDVFIGSERSALEAIAMGKAVILAAEFGYLGLFGPEKAEKALRSNFSLRGESLVETSLLVQEIEIALGLEKNELNKIRDFERNYILENYSVEKMIDDHIKVYLSLLEANNVLVSGYYGFNNLGDEAILTTMYTNLMELDLNINFKALSNKPKETMEKYGINSIYRFNILKVLKSIKESDVFISGGGSLLQDNTSTRSLLYYTSLIFFAKLFNKKIMMYANGIGPVVRKVNRSVVQYIANKPDLITLREQNSYEELIEMGFVPKKDSKVFITADPVFTMSKGSRSLAEKILEENNIPRDKKMVAVSVRSWQDIDEFIFELAKVCDSLVRDYDVSIVFIVLHMPNDIKTSEKLMEKMSEKAYILNGNYSPVELMSLIGEMHFVLSMRLHSLIFAARQRVPFIGFVYDPKVEYYLDMLKMPSGGSIKEFKQSLIAEDIKEMMNDREKYVEIMSPIVDDLEEKAKLNEYYLDKLIRGDL